MASSVQSKKSLKTLSFMALIILAPTVVFTVTGDAPQTLVLALLGLALSFITRHPLDRTTRSFVYTALAAVVTAVISDQALPVKQERFFLMPAELYCPMVIYLAIALTFFDQRESNVSAVIGLSLVAMMMAGNVLGFRVPHERLPISASADERLHEFYALAVGIQLLACLALLPRAPWRAKHRPPGQRHRLLRTALMGLFLTGAFFAALSARSLAHEYEGHWQRGFMRLMQRYMYRSGRRVVFGREVDLWRTVRYRLEQDKTVILRIISDKPPGYLRGRVYTGYLGGTWRGSGRSAGLQQEVPGGRLAYSVYRRGTPPGTKLADPGVETMDVMPAGGFHTEVLLAPGHASEFELIAETVAHSNDGELTPNEWEQQIGYQMMVPAHSGQDAYFGPDSNRMKPGDYLNIPPRLRADIEPVAHQALGPKSASLAPGEAFDRVIEFLNSNYTYELGVEYAPAPDGRDPVVQFLTDVRRGHCELFAASAVLLLRTRGIPARYVTGVVCLEQVGLSYWVSRLMDVHAWCEAYDAANERWVLVEATPPSGIPRGEERFEHVTSLFDRFRFNWQYVLALMKRGTVASAIVAIVTAVIEALGWLLLNPIGGPIFVACSAFFIYRWWDRRQRGEFAEGTTNQQHLRLQRLYLNSVKSLRRRFPDLPARPTAGQIEDNVSRESGAAADLWRECLAQYQRLRFGTPDPKTDDVDRVAGDFREALKQTRKALAALER